MESILDLGNCADMRGIPEPLSPEIAQNPLCLETAQCMSQKVTWLSQKLCNISRQYMVVFPEKAKKEKIENHP